MHTKTSPRRVRLGEQGLTLVEMLVTTLVLSLAVACMASSVDFGVRMFHQSLNASESRVLCSTLTDIIRNELAMTTYVEVAADGSTLEQFVSPSYAVEETKARFYAVEKNDSGEYVRTSDGYGELFLGGYVGGELVGKALLSDVAYDVYHLGAHVDVSVQVDGTAVQSFTVNLTVRDAQGRNEATTFSVIPLNSPTLG